MSVPARHRLLLIVYTAFAREIERLVPVGAPLGIVRNRYEDIVYYSGRNAEVQLRPGQRLERGVTHHPRRHGVPTGNKPLVVVAAMKELVGFC